MTMTKRTAAALSLKRPHSSQPQFPIWATLVVNTLVIKSNEKNGSLISFLIAWQITPLPLRTISHSWVSSVQFQGRGIFARQAGRGWWNCYNFKCGRIVWYANLACKDRKRLKARWSCAGALQMEDWWLALGRDWKVTSWHRGTWIQGWKTWKRKCGNENFEVQVEARPTSFFFLWTKCFLGFVILEFARRNKSPDSPACKERESCLNSRPAFGKLTAFRSISFRLLLWPCLLDIYTKIMLQNSADW